jgi:competence ComEA-like helix-hairpin-helix protein
MMWTRRQLEGAIAIAACLAALITADSLLHGIPPVDRTPVQGDERSGSIITELAETTGVVGVYFMPEGTTVADLLHTAHMPVDERLPRKVLSLRLKPGMRVTAGSGDYLAVGEMKAGTKVLFGLPLDLNTATYDDLLLLPGIGESMAWRIIDRRQTYGNFTCIEDLTRLQGIKEKKLSILRKYLIVHDARASE